MQRVLEQEQRVANLIADVGARSESANEHALAVRSMFDRISPTYDLLNRLLSVGIDKRWRKRALQLLARDLVDGPLLDSCAGTLDLAQAMAHSFAGRRVIAADFAREMIVRGRTKVGPETGLAVADAMRLPIRDEAFAGMTCAFGMRNLSNTEQGLREAFRVLKPGGTFVVLEFYRPSRLLIRRRAFSSGNTLANSG